jgi:hypothetical protein
MVSVSLIAADSIVIGAIMPVAGSFLATRLSENSIGPVDIQIGEDNSTGVDLRSSPFSFVDPVRASIVFACADIHAFRPNCSFASSLIYHNSPGSINNYVEAEQRTIAARR